MSNLSVTSISAVRGGNSEFLLKFNTGAQQWVDMETLYKAYLSKKLPNDSFVVHNGNYYVVIFGMKYKINSKINKIADKYNKRLSQIEEPKSIEVPKAVQPKVGAGQARIKVSPEMLRKAAEKDKERKAQEQKSRYGNSNSIILLNKDNVDFLYNMHWGNIYYKEDKAFHIVDGFSLEDVKNALNNKVVIFYVGGEPLNSEEVTKIIANFIIACKSIKSKKDKDEIDEFGYTTSLRELENNGVYSEGNIHSSYDFNVNEFVGKN